MSERREALRWAKTILDDAHRDPDSHESMAARRLLLLTEQLDSMHQQLRDYMPDPYQDLIHSNRDVMLKMHEDAIQRVRLHLAMDDPDKALAVLDALNMFHPMHAESWKGWPE